MTPVHIYTKVTDTNNPRQIDIFGVYDLIRSDRLKQATEHIQTKHKSGIEEGFKTISKDGYQKAKRDMLPVVLFAGCFDRSKDANEQTVKHSGRMNVDIDLNTREELDELMDIINETKIPYIEAAARSVSGAVNGSLWVNVMIEIPESLDDVPEILRAKLKLTESDYVSKLHTAFFELFSDMLTKGLGIIAGTTKDIKRLRYLSYDPDIFVNIEAKPIGLAQLQLFYEQKDKVRIEKDLHLSRGTLDDPFEIAIRFAEKRVGALMPGNNHIFITYMSIALNKMGIPERDVEDYVSGVLQIQVNSNCISYPYAKYSGEYGSWDWERAPSSAPTSEGTQPKQKPVTPSQYFSPLGFSKDDSGSQRFWFYAFMSSTIISMTPGKMSKANLMQLAPWDWWGDRFQKANGSFNLDTAQDFLITIGNKKGFFSPLRLRGRGAWMDYDRVLIHAGDSLIVDGIRHELGTIETEYVYEINSAINLSPDNPLPASEACKLLHVVEELSFKRGRLDAVLLCGWLAIVPICGVLTWRPHIWVSGRKHSGKTWVNKNIINRMVGECAFKVEGGSTEAGIRELIGNDAMAVVFDEAEGEDDRQQQTMQGVLHLSRSASSSENMIVKGTGNGAKAYNPRGCFSMSSIVPQIKHGADVRRYSIIEMWNPLPLEEFKQISNYYNSFADDEYVRAFQARMVTLIPQILESTKMFKSALNKVVGSGELAEQMAPMFAGTWHIENDRAATLQDAIDVVSAFNFGGVRVLQTQSDEERCLNHIISMELRVETGYGIQTVSVVELIERAKEGLDVGDSNPLTGKVAEQALKRKGMRIYGKGDEFFAIQYDSVWLNSILQGTAWTTDPKSVLERLDGAHKHSGNIRFGPGNPKQAILIPIDIILG